MVELVDAADSKSAVLRDVGVRVSLGAPLFSMNRCLWVNPKNPLYITYHDEEWGVPVHEDRKHFECLILEGAQAGLSWETVLRKRAAYRQAFHGFDPLLVSQMSEGALDQCLQNPGLIRHRQKIQSVRQNARVFLDIQRAFGSFDTYVWAFVGGSPRVNRPKTLGDMNTQTPESQALSKDLKKRGMRFVGPTIIQSYMQAAGLFNDHVEDCCKG